MLLRTFEVVCVRFSGYAQEAGVCTEDNHNGALDCVRQPFCKLQQVLVVAKQPL